MKTRILMLTYNRPAYTEMALGRLCDTLPADAGITVWDNGSGPELRAVLKKFEGHPRVERIIYHPTNDKLRGPTNWFWSQAGDAAYLGKVDDDCLMPDNWVETLEQALSDIPAAGILGAWMFPEEDFVEELAVKKIQTFGPHRLLRNCWLGGAGYLMKREVINKIGILREDESFTGYCIRAAAAGFINGWYFPFLYMDHMDDPRSPHTGFKTEEDFQRMKPLSAATFSTRNREEWTRKQTELARILQSCSFDPEDYSGWRSFWRRKCCQLLGRPYAPKV
jgi:GT2 family glycosyltransferase